MLGLILRIIYIYMYIHTCSYASTYKYVHIYICMDVGILGAFGFFWESRPMATILRMAQYHQPVVKLLHEL